MFAGVGFMFWKMFLSKKNIAWGELFTKVKRFLVKMASGLGAVLKRLGALLKRLGALLVSLKEKEKE